MSSFTSQDIPSLGHYAFNLRDGLRKAARSTLQELEDNIARTGYEWLDGYMEQILNRESRAPITELMKTPSRTQTVKKTRATTAAAKDRTDKVKGLNARMALSPVGNKQSSRAPLSPLGSRSLNAQASPNLLAAPKASPAKVKADKSSAVKAQASKPKSKKGRSKKAVEGDEDIPPQTQDKESAPASHRSSSSASSKDKIEVETVKEKSRSARSKKEKVKAVPSPENMDVDVNEDKDTLEAAINVVDDEESAAPTLSIPTTGTVKDLSMIVEGEEDSRSTSIRSNVVDQPARQPDDRNSSEGKDSEKSTEGKEEKATLNGTIARPDGGDHPRDIAFSTVQSQPQLEPAISTPALPPAPLPANTAPLPVRQVRSSWLSKALGTGTVPINLTEPNPTARKSYAAPTQNRQSTAMDFTGLRKSLAPIGGLKRKSDEGMESDSDEEEKRPDKVGKFSGEPPIKPMAELSHTTHMPSRTPGPVPRPLLPTKTPSFGTASTIHPDSQGRSTNLSTEQQRSDIHKVTKALDELREKTAAKELAKQKAALAASTGPARMPQAKSTGTGFLRGLGSLGAGLLGLGNSAEEEAERLARELEEERLAEQELEKLMREATKPETEAALQQKVVEEKTKDEQPVRSTTPDISPVHSVEQQPLSPEEEEEMIEEQSIMEDLIAVDLPAPAPAPFSRQTVVLQEPGSTTPTGTPTRPIAVHVKASALPPRSENHVHEPSVASQKEAHIQQHEAEPQEMRPDSKKSRAPSVDDDEEMEEEEEREEHLEYPKGTALVPTKSVRSEDEHKTHRKLPSSSSSVSLLAASTASQSANSTLGQAAIMAAKALGVKPPSGTVKSLQLAAAAAKKEQAAADRKAIMKDQADHRKQLLAKKKAEEERVRAEEERKSKIAEIEEKRKIRAEHEKRKKERDERLAAIAKEKAAKEEREAAAARAKQAEEDAARKRKLAAALSKSQNGNGSSIKRPPGQGLQQSQTTQKGNEPFRPSKQISLSGSTQSSAQPQKLGPSVFRTADAAQHTQTQNSTISLVTQNQNQAQHNAERKALGPPSRPSAMANHPYPQPMRQSTAVHQAQGQASAVLQQSRVALQSHLEEKATLIQSEDIVLPDIASEYSDSDDEDRTKDFERPQWAESPELRHALEAQAHRNPDELFGPIKPLNMEELFKVRTGKFRARTSSANWSKGDGLTRAEEVEYAKRMGFKASGAAGASGSGNVF
ncbi:hypothetical protein IAR55_003082 [Kwoniella newhampshirensis]|uniref:Inner centromere protein ARK-binding domain-containing protein n=1 Tax=Kwoniella newhampshirensis TaxID=1651941 RepID=A0AAW0Z0M9_9TREE